MHLRSELVLLKRLEYTPRRSLFAGSWRSMCNSGEPNANANGSWRYTGVTQETCFQVHSPLGIALIFISKLFASVSPPKLPGMVIMIFLLPKNLQVFPDNMGMWTGVMRRSQKGLHGGKGVFL